MSEDMREIKFRAWHWERKEMFEVEQIDFSDMEFRGDTLQNEVSEPENRDYEWHALGCCDLMQYTGLKDKKGKEIYEGDIVYVDSWSLVGKNPHAQVKWVKGLKIIRNYSDETVKPVLVDCYIIESTKIHMQISLSDALDFLTNLRVVGNIYENPNLIKEEV